MVRDEELAKRLVVRRGTKGNCTYDEGAKRELIELCRNGTVSVAKVALTYGINPNLLHNWIALARKEGIGGLPAPVSKPSDRGQAAFIPVVTAPVQPSATGNVRLDITLDNGIQADLCCLSRDDVLAILPLLAQLPCSASTRR